MFIYEQFQREHNGSLYDRGSADSYYRRRCSPHWYPGGTHTGLRIDDLTAEEVAEYMAGYNDNEVFGDRKEYS